MTVMPGLRQFVSLVSKGGSPVMLADAFGNPYPTTGHGSLVFNEGAELFDPILHGVVNVAERLVLAAGSPALPALAVGDDDTGIYSPGPGTLGFTADGTPSLFIDASGIQITGDITYTGVLHGAFHSPLTTRGDVYYFGATGPTRLPLGLAGNFLASNGTDLVYAPPVAGGTVTSISGVAGETVASPDPIVASGSIGLADSGVAPAIYGDATHIPRIQVDAKGRITSAIEIPVTTGGTVTSITPGTGLTSTPNPIVTAGTINLANTTVVPASYGDATNIPQIVIDAQGRITSATNIAVSIPPAGVTSIAPGNTTLTFSPNPIVSTGTIVVNTTVIATKTDLNAYLPLLGGTVTGTVVYQPTGPITANTPAISVLQTWNNAAVSFNAFSMNITDSASNAGSRLMSLQVGGSDRFTVDKFGNATIAGVTNIGGGIFANGASRILIPTAPPAGGTLGSGYMLGSTTNFGLMYGTGVPDKAAPIGTIYMRADAPGVPSYNFDGTNTGWSTVGGVWVGTTPPVNPQQGQQWWYSDNVSGGGQMFLYYVDPSGAPGQWVASSPSTSAASTTPGGDFCATGTGAAMSGTPTTLVPTTIISGNTGAFYNIANGRYTPPAGRYVLNGWVRIDGPASQSGAFALLYKNGTQLPNAAPGMTVGPNFVGIATVQVTADANGTDFFEFKGQSGGAGGNAFLYGFSAFPISGIQGPPGAMPTGNYWRQLKRVVPVAGQATVDFNPGDIPADINDLMFTVRALPQVSDVGFFMRMNDGTGFDTGTSYYSNIAISQSNVSVGTGSVQSTDTVPASSAATAQIRMTYNAAGNGVSSAAAEGIAVEGKIFSIRDTTMRKRGVFNAYWWQGNNNSMVAASGGFSWQSTTGILQGLRFYFGTGNFAAGGAITLWGSP